MTEHSEIIAGPSTNKTGYPAYVVQIDDNSRRDMINLQSLYEVGKQNFKMFTAIMVLSVVGALLAAFLIRPSFESEAVVIIKSKNTVENSSAMLGQIGNLGTILGFGGASNDQTKTYEMLTSREMTIRFINERGVKPVLFASRWNTEENRWKSDNEDDHPTDLQAYYTLMDGILSITQDRQTSVITVTVRWFDPEIASAWTNGIIEVADEVIRQKDLEESNHNLEYLNAELDRTNNALMKQSIVHLVESEMNRAMLASASGEYVLQIVDAALPPEGKVWPNLKILLALGIIAGAGLCSLIWIFKYSRVQFKV